ncbi:hypothetical protein, partial [Dyella japonica]|uniref:hypothetical protein n=1 Tax=Dyella japonica TaxID=231455 RepID=UPI000584CAC0
IPAQAGSAFQQPNGWSSSGVVAGFSPYALKIFKSLVSVLAKTGDSRYWMTSHSAVEKRFRPAPE